MRLRTDVLFRAGITWGLVAVVLAILGAVLSPILPRIDGLALGTFALMFAGVHYSARARTDALQSGIGGGLAGIVAAVLLLLIRLVPGLDLPLPPGAPVDFISALFSGFVAGAAGGLAYEIIDR